MTRTHEPPKVASGRCPNCRNVFRLYPNGGKLRPHKRGIAGTFSYCPGGGQYPEDSPHASPTG